jgi:hypothetical protein
LVIDKATRGDDVNAGKRDIGPLRVAKNVETALFSFLLNAMSITAAS